MACQCSCATTTACRWAASMLCLASGRSTGWLGSIFRAGCAAPTCCGLHCSGNPVKLFLTHPPHCMALPSILAGQAGHSSSG